ncbi:MurR/RpiR family transcriptional regulator [Brevibacillus sp. TJ4]|uniref:MurR/RpiR family transcriptional regulator n=1 Tax=Brevibacillus sp. TJ4 TaxID=3234853 RepID=UPI003B9EB956
MTQGRKPGVIARLNKTFPTLNGALREVGASILNDPDKVVRMNVTSLAELSNTSESAVVRLAKKLGYTGFRDMQINLAYDLGDQTRKDNQEIELTDSVPVIAEKSFHANVLGLSQTREILDAEALTQAAQFIHRARAVHIFAQGINYSTAIDLSYNLVKLGILCQVYNDSYMQGVASSISDKSDVAIGISHTGANRDVIEALSISRQNGTMTIGITAKEFSPITKMSEISLCTSPNEMLVLGEPFSSRMNMMYLVDILFLRIASLSNKNGMNSLQKVKDALEAKRYPG